MKLLLSVPFQTPLDEVLSRASKKLKRPQKQIEILKKSLDARDKGDIRYVYTLACEKPAEPKPLRSKREKRVIIAGAGPAGLFCAYRLILSGLKPLVVERGKPVEERERDVYSFFQGGELNEESNVQFGEGGAGTFSDGKLNTQTNSPYHRFLLKTFVKFGAPEEVGYLAKPHVGSDNLQKVVKNLRNFLLSEGAEIRYQTKLDGIETKGGALSSVLLNGERTECDALVLAIGHSARDTFELLYREGFLIEQKEFAAGVRIEHLQSEISRAQYGEAFPLLPPADYKLVSHASSRALFTFCMCPGGVVVPSASERGGLVVNGMSNFLREGKNANSALVVQVKREDFFSSHPLAGVEYQRKLERAAFALGGDYRAPVQLLGDFLEDKSSSSFGRVLPSYSIGTRFAPLKEILPPPICSALKAGIGDFERKIKGFSAEDAVLTAVESRTSSPVRILRGEDMQAKGKRGIYPCGEGCGYSGGILSSAADGIKVADEIIKTTL